MPITSTNTGQTTITTLDGYIFPVDPTDPVACFTTDHSDYLGTKLLMVNLDGQYYPLHLCGDTNTGMNWNGCSHGEVTGGGADPDCEWVRTGEKVVAQACILDECSGYIFDVVKSPRVLMAKIGDQWYIVNVVTGGALPDTDDMGQAPCPGACCGAGAQFLEATITGCGGFAGQTFELESTIGGGSWTGSITVNGSTFEFSVTCSVETDGAEDWVVLGGCGAQKAPDELTVDCDAVPTGTGTGTGATGGMSGVAIFYESGCDECSNGQIGVTFTTLDKGPRDLCRTLERTGEIVVAEACGLTLEVGDEVILASVEKTGETTGTGASASQDTQNHIVHVCRTEGECPPCPPPPPPDPYECCEFTADTVPQSLTGLLTVTSVIDGCNCSEKTVTFDLVQGSNPPEWTQVGNVQCEQATGTSVSMDLLSGMSITCGGATGTAQGTGTGIPFYLTPPSCIPDTNIESDSGQCEPFMAGWDAVNIRGCCGPVLDQDVSDEPVYMSLEVSE
jgi:hypothetical protein